MDLPDFLQPDAWAALLLVSLAKGTLLLITAALVVRLLRPASAATRHLVWTFAFVAALAMPLLLLAIPGWDVPLLPAESAAVFGGGLAASNALSATAVTESAAGLVNTLSPVVGLLLVWLLGALIVAVRWGGSVLSAGLVSHQAQPVRDQDWLDIVWETSRALELRRSVSLRFSSQLRTPMAWGVLHPIVLLPVEAATWTDERRRVVLMHELAHIRRFDTLTQWGAQAALVLHWFNPLAWRGYRRFIVEREHAADDLVLTGGARPSAYAAHLLHLACGARHPEPKAMLAMTPLARRSQIEERLRSILNDQTRRDRLSRGLLVVVGVLVAALVWPVAAIRPVPQQAAPAPQALLPPSAPMAPPAPLPAVPPVPLAPPLPPHPAPAPEPAPEPLPAPVISASVVLIDGDADAAHGPSASGEKLLVRVAERRPPTAHPERVEPEDPPSGERCLTRLDAAFAYEMEEADQRRARLDVAALLPEPEENDDVEAWDALDRRTRQLTAQIETLVHDTRMRTALDWIDQEEATDIKWTDRADFEVDVVVDWTDDVDAVEGKSYRSARVSSDDCPDEARVSSPSSPF